VQEKKMAFRGIAYASVIAGIALVPACAQANMISNGTFSSPCSSGIGICTYTAGDSTSIPGWTVSTGTVDLITTYWQTPPGGGNSVDLNGNGTGGLGVSNTFATVAGDTYVLDFELSGNPDGGANDTGIKTVEVDIGGVIQDFTFDVFANGGNSHGDMKWAAESLTFTATGNLTSLSFTSLTDGFYGPVIGDIDVHPVPEPTTLALLGAGLLGMGAMRRRRAAKNAR
jgi:choice-of-anchor C domain-containing protein